MAISKIVEHTVQKFQNWLKREIIRKTQIRWNRNPNILVSNISVYIIPQKFRVQLLNKKEISYWRISIFNLQVQQKNTN